VLSKDALAAKTVNLISSSGSALPLASAPGPHNARSERTARTIFSTSYTPKASPQEYAKEGEPARSSANHARFPAAAIRGLVATHASPPMIVPMAGVCRGELQIPLLNPKCHGRTADGWDLVSSAAPTTAHVPMARVALLNTAPRHQRTIRGCLLRDSAAPTQGNVPTAAVCRSTRVVLDPGDRRAGCLLIRSFSSPTSCVPVAGVRRAPRAFLNPRHRRANGSPTTARL
jgi:hypothetical protein